jgi:tripartite-type tricarboxylate transporter receptor subunit TctC
MIVGTSPGGGADLTTRLIGPRIAERLKQPIVVENRPGASGVIAGGYVAQQQPDGLTFLVDITTHAVNPAMRSMPYKVLEDLVPVCQVIRASNALAVHPSFPVDTLEEFVAYARERKADLSYASSGNGSAQHLAMEIFKSRAGLEMTHVPYKGGGQSLVDVMAGHVPVCFAFIPSASQYIREGRLKAIAVTGSSRTLVFPALPTIAELGYPGFEVYDWNGVFAPGRTPEAKLQEMRDAVVYALSAPEVKLRLSEMDLEPVGDTPEAFRSFLEREMEVWGAVVRRLGIRAD